MYRKKLMRACLAGIMAATVVGSSVPAYAAEPEQVAQEGTVQEERTVYVSFATEDGVKVSDDVLPIKVSGTIFHTSKLTKLPAGYELCSVGDVYVGEADAVTVAVRKVETVKATVLRVVYKDEATQEVVGEETLTGGRQNEDGKYIFNADIDFNIPEGYEAAVNYGDIELEEGTASSMECLVKKAPEFEYAKVTYVDADNGEYVVGYGTAKVERDATYFHTSILTDIPEGYEIAEVGDMPIVKGEAVVKIRKVNNVQEVTITYIHKTTGDVVGHGKLNAYKNETYFNTSRLTDIPEGYVIAEVGDMPIEKGAATVYVYKATDMEELQPSTPVEPSKPADPDKNDGNKTDDKKKDDKKDNKKDDKKKAVKTGDEADSAAAVLPAGISLAAILALLKKRK